MAKLQAGDPIDLLAFSKASAPIGEVKQTMLPLAQFQEQNLGEWFPMDGRSCLGTAYHTLTGNANVPDMMTEGAFIRQAKEGRILGSYESDEIKAHNHKTDGTDGGHSHLVKNGADAMVDWYSARASVNDGNYISGSVTGTTGGTETRPKNIALNFFIKVNN